MFEEESGTRGPGSKSRLRWVVIAALAVSCLYAFYMVWVLHYPAIRGVVVDQTTGQAIPGAEIYTTAQGYVFPQEKAVLDMNGGSHAAVASGGMFSFSGGVGMRWGLFWPLQYVNGAGLEVYAREYMPIEFSEVNRITPGSWRPTTCEETFRKEGDWEVFSSVYGTLKRRRLFLRGWTYRIEMIKAVSQEQWEKKCHETELLNSLYVPKEISDEWLFDDLTGYLERWPEGEKAGEHYKLLCETANLVPCNPYERDDFVKGRLTRARLQTYCARAAKIIALAEGFSKPPRGMTQESFKSGLDEGKRQLACARDLLGVSRERRNGGTP